MLICLNYLTVDFKESLPQIEAAIEASSFLAIDTEFTGAENPFEYLYS